MSESEICADLKSKIRANLITKHACSFGGYLVPAIYKTQIFYFHVSLPKSKDEQCFQKFISPRFSRIFQAKKITLYDKNFEIHRDKNFKGVRISTKTTCQSVQLLLELYLKLHYGWDHLANFGPDPAKVAQVGQPALQIINLKIAKGFFQWFLPRLTESWQNATARPATGLFLCHLPT